MTRTVEDRTLLVNFLRRCTGYIDIVKAVKRSPQLLRGVR